MNEKIKLTVGPSPHLRSGDTTTSIMFDVIISLIPAIVAACLIFGLRSLVVISVSVISCMIAEYITRKIIKKTNTILDLSAVVTGILFAFTLPAGIPLWMVIIGSVSAIVIFKQLFGGIGRNILNPALGARIVLMIAFPRAMSTFSSPVERPGSYISAQTSLSPMTILKTLINKGDISADSFKSDSLPSLKEMLLGMHSGSIGEVCAVALILGGIYLVARRVISPIIPFVYTGCVAFIMLFAGQGNITFIAYEILGGGLLLGSIFMATDYTTSPITFKGKIVFAMGCGLITCIFRLFGNFSEGVYFSIIIMNALVPLIEKFNITKPFGTEKVKKENAE